MQINFNFLLVCLLACGSVAAQSRLPACPAIGTFNNCFGTYTFKSGATYIGEFRDNKLDGQGTYTFANGDKYVGEFKGSLRNGKGTFTDANGNKYIGEFKNGKRSGQGVLFDSVGYKVREGFWEDDNFVKPLSYAPEKPVIVYPNTPTQQSSKKYRQLFVCFGDLNHDSAAGSFADLLLEILHSNSGLGYAQVISSSSKNFSNSSVGGGCVDHGFDTTRLPANSSKIKSFESPNAFYSLYKNQGTAGVSYTGIMEYK